MISSKFIDLCAIIITTQFKNIFITFSEIPWDHLHSVSFPTQASGNHLSAYLCRFAFSGHILWHFIYIESYSGSSLEFGFFH